MSDKFSTEKEKLIRLEKILRSDISKRAELERKNQSTSIVNLRLILLFSDRSWYKRTIRRDISSYKKFN